MIQRRSQAERRHETRTLVLNKATTLFGENGYNNTSLQDIADACELTIRPIYHYFGNKKKLFLAVTEHLERILADQISNSSNQPVMPMTTGWNTFLKVASDKNFQQIVLIDAPNILGKERWATSSVVNEARKVLLNSQPDISQHKAELITRMVIAALAEAALMIAETEDIEAFSRDISELLEGFLKRDI